MKHDLVKTRSRLSDIQGFLALYAKNESGQMTVLGTYMILIMLILGGLGVDLMNNETDRTRLQAVSDRAVLAAADLDQTQTPENVVQDYFDKSNMGDFVSSVKVDEGINFRKVEVNALTETDTTFMDMFGIKSLKVPAKSIAEEKVNKVEVSLVLDISGSMDEGNKMVQMQEAAGTFVDSVLKPENEGLISVSLVPYSQHVNAGPDIFNRLNVNQRHGQSHCIEFPDRDFTTTYFNKNRTYEHMQHFQWNYYSIETGSQLNTMHDTMCPRYSYERIVPFSQNPSFLRNQIDQMKPRAGTQIFLGMKWATALLDPSFRSINQSLANSGKIDHAFGARPAAYDDVETLKTIVLMTDGQNSSAARIQSRYYRNESLVEHWKRYNFQFYLNHYVSSWRHKYFYYTKYTAARGDALLASICRAAKDNKVVIWSIGFEVSDHGAAVMRDCASSPSHFFRVEGVDIQKAFEAVARQINQLRLIQ